MNNQVWIGIDVAKDSFHAAIADADAAATRWTALPDAEFAHSRKGVRSFIAWLAGLGYTQQTIAGVCIEATGRYSEQWTQLVGDRLGAIAVVNPARPAAYAKSLGIHDKSDRVDACVLAFFGKTTQPRPKPQTTPVQRQLRELARTYAAIAADHQAYGQRLNSGITTPAARRTLRKVMRALHTQMRELEDQIDQLIRTDDRTYADYKRAMTVKGVGPKTAAVILAEFGDLRQYNRNEVIALAGLYPRERTSGSSVRKKARMIKAGKSAVRAHLYMGAMNAVKHDPHLRAFAQRLAANGKNPMQILGAVMRKMLLLIHAVIVSERDYDIQYPHPAYCPST